MAVSIVPLPPPLEAGTATCSSTELIVTQATSLRVES
jgi:hypothetical protein